MSQLLKSSFIALIMSVTFVCIPTQSKAQGSTIWNNYSYDATGNRTGKTYTIVYMKHADTTEIKALAGGYVVKVYPNPAKEYFQVQINGLTSDNITKIEIHNIKGEVLFHQENIGDALQIPIKEWMVGTYFLTVTIDGKPSYWKMIKED